MERVEIFLDTPTRERAQRLARSRGYTLEELLKQIIEQLDAVAVTPDPVLGVFADDPALIDQVADDAMRSREAHVLRHTGE